MKNLPRSLFHSIFRSICLPLLLLWLVSWALTYLIGQSLANQALDRNLARNTHMLAELLSVRGGEAHFQAPSQTSHLLINDSDNDDDAVHYRITAPDGTVLAGQDDLPQWPSTTPLVNGKVHLYDAQWMGQDIRMATLQVPMALPGHPSATVQMAESRKNHHALASEITQGVVVVQSLLLPLTIALLWWGIKRGMQPLRQLEHRIRDRHPDDLTPMGQHSIPSEVGPLVEAINDLFHRLGGSLSSQKQFLANAAHQLKTPLAGLRMQAELAQRADCSPQDVQASLMHIGRTSIRATHTVNQLLALARVENGKLTPSHQTVDLARIVMDVVRDAVPQALEQRIDLGYHGPEPGTGQTMLRGNPTLLAEMVRNLVDNALRYTPMPPAHGGMVTARLVTTGLTAMASATGHATTPPTLELHIEDSGPGIKSAERTLIFKPFYRTPDNTIEGSGLGLSIVLEIVQQHGAAIYVSDAHPHLTPHGTRFTIRFPALTARQAPAAHQEENGDVLP